MRYPMWHKHEDDPEQRVFGRLLEVGDRLEAGDVKSSFIERKWVPIPPALVNETLTFHAGSLFVRPVKES